MIAMHKEIDKQAASLFDMDSWSDLEDKVDEELAKRGSTENVIASAFDADESVELASLEKAIINCLPAVQIAKDLIFPAIPAFGAFLQKTVYKFYTTHIIKRADSVKLAQATSLLSTLSMFENAVKWMETHQEALINSPRMCKGINPSSEDLESILESIGLGLDNDDNEDALGRALARTLIDPFRTQRRIDNLINSLEKSEPLTQNELNELSDLQDVQILLAL
jgi:hypothetical protein